MALDLHSLENGRAGRHILSIDDEMFGHLSHCFSLVHSKSGVLVDQYTDIKLPWRSYDVILDGIAEVRVASVSKAETAALNKLEAALRELDNTETGAIFVGD